MIRGRISDKTKQRFKRRIKDVIDGLSRPIQIYKQPLRSNCPNCFFDELTGRSTGKCKWTALEAKVKQAEYEQNNNTLLLQYKFFKVGRCPVCNGKGFLEVQRKVWVNAIVTWGLITRDNTTTVTPAGIEGATIAELKTKPEYLSLFKNCKKIIVEGYTCKLVKPPILRGLGNDSVLVATVFTTDGINTTDDVLLKKY